MSSLARRPEREQALSPTRLLGAVVAIVAGSAAATALARVVAEPLPALPFLVAIVGVAIIGGLVAGLIETAVSVVLLDVAVLPPGGEASLRTTDVAALAAFALAACAVVIMIVRQQRDRDDARRELDRLAFLAGASEVLEASLDFDEALQRLADYVTPSLADWCVIHVAGEADGELRQVAVAHQDPAHVRMALELQQRYPIDPAATAGVPQVLRSGRPELYATLDDDMLVRAATDDEHLAAIRRIGMRSVMIAPLGARGATFGSLTLVSTRDGASYDEGDVDFVMELARRAALSIDTIRSYQLATRTSERNAVLQRLASSLSRAAGVPAVVNALLKDALNEIGARAALVATLTGHDAELEVVGQLGYRQEVIDRWGRFPVEANLPMSDAVRERRPVVMETVADRDERYPTLHDEAITADHAVVCLPMIVQDRVVGGMSISFPEPRRFDAETMAFLEAIAVQTGQAVRRAALFEAERAARREAERANDRLALIAEASALVNEQLGFSENLEALAALLVKRVADLCIIDIADEDGRIRRVTAIHRDPGKQHLADVLRDAYPPGPAEKHPVIDVMRTGIPAWAEDMPAAFVRDRSIDDEQASIVARLGFESFMAVPLRARGRILGVLSLVSTDPLHRYAQRDVDAAMELAGRAALWIDNARLYEERDTTARALQESLLPRELPPIPGLELAARYWPAGEGNEVGGDFYDVFQVLPGRWLAIIGDVCGRGPEAAAVMGIARHASWAIGPHYESPSKILRELNRVLRPHVRQNRFCTVCVVRIEPRDGRTALSIACGGHPLPVLLGRGDPAAIGRPGSLLGVVDDPAFSDVELELGDEESLVLYTDGVCERGGENLSLEQDPVLASALTSLRGAEPIASVIEAVLSEQRLSDDAAVLTISRPPSPPGGPRGRRFRAPRRRSSSA
jgi:GAF domain-containing protein